MSAASFSALRARPAQLQAAVAVETPYGGRVTTWLDTAVAWVTLGPIAARTTVGEGGPETLETATADARDDPRATRGLRLVLAGEPPWTVTAVDRSSPGRMTLRLER